MTLARCRKDCVIVGSNHLFEPEWRDPVHSRLLRFMRSLEFRLERERAVR
jgi:hypothetical protein